MNLILLIFFIGSWPNEALAKDGNDNINFFNALTIDFQKNFTGTINNKLGVVFQIENKGNELSGSYFYIHKGIDIKLTGKMTGQHLEMYELDYLNNKTAKIYGELKDSNFSGIWESLNSMKSFPIILKETETEVDPLPSKIEGIYKTLAKDEETGDDTPCELSITITKNEGAYYYHLKTNMRDVNGKVSFDRDIEAKETYITFEGIKWAEYEGDVSNKKAEKKTNGSKDIPVGIDGLFTESEITIQNDGNSMNYYVKFNECDRKFIRLLKE
ncbi:MAG: hypothetical protein PHF97_11615 [Bacteroidales bacterium]|nr:hypothetical protein [Bacteroidales bacterium]